LDYYELGSRKNLPCEWVDERFKFSEAMARWPDKIILDALMEETQILTMENLSADPLTLLEQIKAELDSRGIPAEGRCLIVPSAALPMFFSNTKIQPLLSANDIAEGRIDNLLGFEVIFLMAGLECQIVSGGANRRWTCYATSRGSIGQVFDFCSDCTADGSGKIFESQEVANRGGYSITVSFRSGAKVLIPERIVRFSLETENYDSNTGE
jgi:hypothetical protein